MRHVMAASLLGLALAANPVHAHHSFAAEFDAAKPITITGPLTKMEWANPHIFLHVDAKDGAGNVTNWAVEMGNIMALIRLGWKRDDIKIGDTLTVEGFLARDGSKLMNAKTVLLNGRKMFAGSSQATTP
jgi:Family of unknown function (DUF6152)